MKIALYPGSFDPITNGHLNIIDQAIKLFDHLIVAVGENEQKKYANSTTDRVHSTQKALQGYKNVVVTAYEGITADYCKEVKANFIVRGIRNVSDFEYEKNMAYANQKLSGIQTIFLISSLETSYISSSLIRELKKHNVDHSDFAPMD